MVVSLEEKKLLETLGLTSSQVRVYLSLIYDGPSKVGQISKNSKIHRTHLYQVLHSLEAAGLVEKNLSDSSYNPMPLKDALEMLINQKNQEIARIEAVAKTIGDVSTPDLKQETNPELIITTNKNQILNKFESNINSAKKTIYHMHSWNRFLILWHNHCETFSKVMARGVVIKQIVEIPEDTSQIQNYLGKHVFSDTLFNVRFVPKTGGNFSIIDEQKILISTSAERKISQVPPVISSNYLGLIEAMKKTIFWLHGKTG